MKLGHAAALALVGWYLLMPPIHALGPTDDPKTKVEIQTHAPLSQWKKAAEFDSEKTCEDSKREEGKKTHGEWWFNSMLCVSSDDPRLNAK